MALLCGRSFALAIGVLGVLRAGGCYVPLDPEHPRGRLATILDDVGARVIVCEEALASALPEGRALPLPIDDLAGEAALSSAEDSAISEDEAAIRVDPEHLAYIIYTSGSTGRPKGVALPHAALVNLIDWHAAHHLHGAAVLQFAALGFDLCFYEHFLAWRTGGVIHLIDAATRRDMMRLGATIRDRRIARVILPVVVLQQLAEAHVDAPEVLASLREVTSSGEQMHLTPPVIRLFEVLRGCTLHNHYGPSETHVATALRLPEDRGLWVPHPSIGEAIAGARALVLDEAMRPCPVGVVGEIYLGGVCLARGYWGRADRTAERFVPDPVSGEPGARLYRSGDLGRLRADGAIDYLGRADEQVKIRGVRVELGEVTAVISTHPRIREAAVVAREDTPGDRRLCAYVVTAATGEREALTLEAELLARCRERLPEAMVPATIMVMEALPLTVNGKVDRQALPRPPARAVARGSGSAEDRADDRPRVPPRRADEVALAAIWREVLGVAEVAMDDDFYALGGHSLALTRVLVRIRRTFGVALPLERFVAAPTLAGVIAELRRAPAGAEVEIAALPRDRPLPASLAQERLWFLHRLDPASPAYACPYAFRLRGPVDAARLQAALDALVRRHEPLRTTFVDDGGRPLQVIASDGSAALARVDLTATPAAAREAALAELLASEARRPFDLERGPLLRAGLVRVAEGDHVLWLVLHHIITDGWSMAVLFAELGALHDAGARGEVAALAPLPLQFADFAAWQRECLSGQVLSDMIEGWRRTLAGAPERLDLPADRPRPAVQSGRGGAVSLALPAERVAAIRGLAHECGVTPATVILAAYAALLGRLGGARDLVIGVPVAARDRLEFEPLVGYFLNIVPVRLDLAGDPSLVDLVLRARDASLGAYARAAVPFERLVQALRPTRSLAHGPLVQVGFSPQVAGDRRLQLAGLEVTAIDFDPGKAVFDLMLYLWEDEDDRAWTAVLEYSADLFDRPRIAAFGERLLALLAGALAEPTRSIAAASILTAQERATRARINAHPGAAAGERGTLCAAVLRQVDARPDALAVAGPGLTLSYAALEARSGALARRLCAAPVRPLIALCLGRGPLQAVAVLGILRAGAAYLPIDPALPPARIRVLLEGGGADTIVVDADTRDRVAAAGLVDLRMIDVDQPAPVGDDAPLPIVGPDDLAYVLYTSGSTGQPKGVMIEHGAVLQSIDDVNRRCAIGPGDRFLALSGLSFDLSVYDLFGPLTVGGALVYPPADGARDPATWPLAGITVLSTVPQLTELLLDSEVPLPTSLRWVLWCGDTIPLSLPDRLRARAPQLRLVSLWGATEASIWSTYQEVGAVDPDWRSVPCGEPLRGQTIYVLDDALQACPDDVEGELFVGGVGLARGYWGDAERTAARFFAHPITGERLYRTGDRARLDERGCLWFCGRGDAQVKIRGHRVELGEIEATLLQHPGVAAAVAVTPDRKRLFAWVVPAAGSAAASLTSAALRSFVAERLPEVMVPAAVFVIDALPLNDNGKVDRRALVGGLAARLQGGVEGGVEGSAEGSVEALPGRSGGDARNRSGSRTAVERILAEIWGEALGLERVDPDAVFFELGGHSLLLPRVRAAIRERLGCELALVELFQHPTIRALSRRIAADAAASVDETPAIQRAPAPPSAMHGAIAIVGAAGRFPGAPTLDALWDNLVGGVESITFSTPEALAAAGVDPALCGSPRFVPAYGLLEDAFCFDAAFFGYSPQEARLLDPQQRVFLECAFTALEDAAIDPARRPLRVGVYAGCDAPYYWLEHVGLPGPPQGVEEFQATFANMPDTLTTRVAHKLGLRGPAVTVLSACSTSLVAVHMACQSLRSRECDAVIAGGVAVGPASHLGHMADETGVTAADGRCRPFDADARGTVNSSAVAAVVLRRLEDAIADGDPIRAVILGSALGNDGADRIGFTAPGVRGQVETITRAHAAAGVDPASITYVEAHGTGTRMGDPIEVRALSEAFRAGTDRQGFCALGSIKGNIGHTSAAAGVTGLIKATLALARRVIPPTLHFRAPNPELGLEGGPFFVTAEPLPWAPEGPRRAGVSAFGIGGTNAHVIVEEAPPIAARGPSRPWQSLAISARNDRALDERLALLAARIDGDPTLDLGDVAHTLARRPALAPARAVVIAEGREDAIAALRGGDARKVLRGRVRRGPPRVALVFPGAGTQHPGMLRELYPREPVIREHLDACIDHFRRELGVDLRPILLPDPGDEEAAAGRLQVGAINMPAIFAVQVALGRLLLAWGLRPDVLVGHSLGEYAASHLAGVMSLADACALIAERSRISEELPAGAMISVRLGEATLLPYLGEELSIAGIPSPDVCVVGGPVAAIERLARDLEVAGVDGKILPLAGAGHSAMIEPFVPRLTARAREVTLRRPTIPLVSSCAGDFIDETVATAEHWGWHFRRTVRFADAIGRLLADPDVVVVEVGPSGHLAGLIRRHPAAGRDRLVVSAHPGPRGGRGEVEALLAAIAQLWCAGVDVDGAAISGGDRRVVPLPSYPFARTRYVAGGSPLRRVNAPIVSDEALELADDDDDDEGATEGDLDPLTRALAAIWAECLGLRRVRPGDNFFDLGGTSLIAMQIRSQIEARLGVRVHAHALVEAPGLAEFAVEIRRDLDPEVIAGLAAEAAPTPAEPPASAPAAAAPRSLVVRLRPARASADAPPIFFIQPIGGTVFTYLALARRLAHAGPIFGLRAPGLEPGEAVLRDIHALTERYLAEITGARPEGPILVGGHSAGGLLAYAVAARLAASGREVSVLMIDAGSPGALADQVVAGADDLRRHLAPFAASAGEAVEALITAVAEGTPLGEVILATSAALRQFQPAPIAAPVLYIAAADARDPTDARAGGEWMELARGPYSYHRSPGDHFTMMEEPNVAVLARLLDRHLA